MFSRIIHYFILPCSEISLLIEKKIGGRLSFFEKIRLALHLKVCRWCNMYSKKVKFLDKALQKTENNKQKATFDDAEIQSFKRTCLNFYKKSDYKS